MKKLFFAAAAMLLMMGANAQNTFKGTVTYQLTSTGSTAMQIPAEQSTVEVMVYDDQAKMGQAIQQGLVLTSCTDYSPYFQAFSYYGIPFDNASDGKFMLRQEIKQSDLDSLTIPVTEGFYFEYKDGETKEVAGRTAKKAILHVFNEEGTDQPIEFWYDPTIGPAHNFLFNGIAGMPLDFTTDLGEGRAITYTATEIKEGKVKERDLLLPAGYKLVSPDDEEYRTFMEDFRDAMQLLQDEMGGDE